MQPWPPRFLSVLPLPSKPSVTRSPHGGNPRGTAETACSHVYVCCTPLRWDPAYFCDRERCLRQRDYQWRGYLAKECGKDVSSTSTNSDHAPRASRARIRIELSRTPRTGRAECLDLEKLRHEALWASSSPPHHLSRTHPSMSTPAHVRIHAKKNIHVTFVVEVLTYMCTNVFVFYRSFCCGAVGFASPAPLLVFLVSRRWA